MNLENLPLSSPRERLHRETVRAYGATHGRVRTWLYAHRRLLGLLLVGLPLAWGLLRVAPWLFWAWVVVAVGEVAMRQGRMPW